MKAFRVWRQKAIVLGWAGLLVAGILFFSSATRPPESFARQDPTPAYRLFLALILDNWPFVVKGPDHLVISEVLAHPSAAQLDVEWIEIYNPAGNAVALSGYKIGDEETLGGREGMLQFPQGATIGSHGVIVIASDAVAFAQAFGFDPDFEMRDSGSAVLEMRKYTAWSGGNINLSNAGDEVLLLDVSDLLVDAVAWGNSTWAGFQPPATAAAEGRSLERFPAYKDTDAAADWTVQPNPRPGDVDLSTPTPTPTRTGTPTPTPTATGTPTPGPPPTPFAEPLLISEVVYDPVGDEPEGEWVELYNASTMWIDLSSFKIGDEETQGESEGMYRFPAGAFIDPGKVVVVANRAESFSAVYGIRPDYEFGDSDPLVPDMVKYPPWSEGNVSLGNSGDEVLLLDMGDQVIDALSWGNSNAILNPAVPDVAEGHSLERYPPFEDTDTAADWRDQPTPGPREVDLTPLTPTPTPTAIPTPFGGAMLISEVYYRPAGAEPGQEWIEIYNPMTIEVDLSNFKIGDEETQNQSEGMLQFPAGAAISPGQVMVIAHDATLFHQLYGYDPDFEMSDSGSAVPDMRKYTQWAGGSLSLSNSGDEVLLLSPEDVVLDAVCWGNSTWAFDPSVPGVAAGHSIARSQPGLDTDTASDWIDQPNPEPGSKFVEYQ